MPGAPGWHLEVHPPRPSPVTNLAESDGLTAKPTKNDMKQIIILGLNGPYNPELLKELVQSLQQPEHSLEILHASHSHDGGPGILIGTSEDIANAGVRVLQVPADEISEHTIPGIAESLKTLTKEFRAFVRREEKSDKKTEEILTGGKGPQNASATKKGAANTETPELPANGPGDDAGKTTTAQANDTAK